MPLSCMAQGYHYGLIDEYKVRVSHSLPNSRS
nr:MAG TPA: Ethylene insensitive 3 [Bacteriophage sp.]